ncbi:nuclear transport factor 2 family protein [Nocardia crassostreae]|uniref:nuclear transport factor 2 family protein n=1 Tax=Nocardia crassostreae TaxID=53428 RepID=UPI000833C961|nr:nuclear transport factor 2 family protein [Nocardia crassostreae]
MSTHTAATRVALAYFDAWTGHDMDKAMTYIAPDIVCDAPYGRMEGADAYRAFVAPYSDILRSAAMLAVFGDENTALVMYDTATETVPSAPSAELVTVENGLITKSRFIFDRLPFQDARAARAAAAAPS